MTVHETQRWVEHKLSDELSPFPFRGVEGDVVLRVRDPAHWQVLRSPYRMRIFEAIRSAGGCAIKDLADALRSSTTALYYHLDLLVRAGMISATVPELEAGLTSRGGRRPAIFMTRGERLVVEYDPSNGRDRRRLAAISRAWIDESQAELQPAIQQEDRDAAIATTSWESLTASESNEVRMLLARVEAVLAQARARRDRSNAGICRASHHVALSMCPAGANVLPSPAIVARPMVALEGVGV